MLDSNLPVFISVAESGSFSQAALRLGKSPQAVFKQITTYEEKLGVKLFDRSPTGMRLTPAGISVYKDAKFLLSFSKESIKRAKEIEKIGKFTRTIVWQNIALAFGVKLIVLMLGPGGIATMWEAVFADVGVALLAILNAVRILKTTKTD